MSDHSVSRLVGALVLVLFALAIVFRDGGAILTDFTLGSGVVGAFAALVVGYPIAAYACSRYARRSGMATAGGGSSLRWPAALGGFAFGPVAFFAMALGLQADAVLFESAINAGEDGSGSVFAGVASFRRNSWRGTAPFPEFSRPRSCSRPSTPSSTRPWRDPSVGSRSPSSSALHDTAGGPRAVPSDTSSEPHRERVLGRTRVHLTVVRRRFIRVLSYVLVCG